MIDEEREQAAFWDLPALRSLLEDVRARGYRLYLTLDPVRDGYEPIASPETEVLQMAVAENSSSLTGLLIAEGLKDPLWLETLAGPSATCLLHLLSGRQSP